MRGDTLSNLGNTISRIGESFPDMTQRIWNLRASFPVETLRMRDSGEGIPNLGERLPQDVNALPDFGDHLSDSNGREKMARAGFLMIDVNQKHFFHHRRLM